MDLDLARVRGLVAVVESRHFGAAAEKLGISQQALSKRIGRLEAELGVRLLDRGGAGGAGGAAGVRLTDAGERFLGPAREALAAAERAVVAAVGGVRALRIDVWGHVYGPGRTVGQVLDGLPGLKGEEVGAGRDFASVAAALHRGEVDAGFGRVPGAELPSAAGGRGARAASRSGSRLGVRVVRFEPVDAVLSAGHELAGATELRPEQLRGSVLRCPAAVDRLDFLTAFADRFGIAERVGGPNLGVVRFVEQVRDDPRCFALLPADGALPEVDGVRSIPLVAPTPLYAWSVVWSEERSRHPGLESLLRGFEQVGAGARWLEYDSERDWLPEGDALRKGVVVPGV